LLTYTAQTSNGSYRDLYLYLTGRLQISLCSFNSLAGTFHVLCNPPVGLNTLPKVVKPVVAELVEASKRPPVALVVV